MAKLSKEFFLWEKSAGRGRVVYSVFNFVGILYWAQSFCNFHLLHEQLKSQIYHFCFRNNIRLTLNYQWGQFTLSLSLCRHYSWKEIWNQLSLKINSLCVYIISNTPYWLGPPSHPTANNEKEGNFFIPHLCSSKSIFLSIGCNQTGERKDQVVADKCFCSGVLQHV